ncbi:MAG: sigma-54-dependent Fis family transcriptional regulator [Acidobacteria bacterium]|nr:sigma-54-dependent Fis family transcriptional regulator [Acidobacteriota bacterium]
MERASSRRPAGDNDTELDVHSPAMRRLLELAARAAQVDSTVLITGESGVGKERLARFIHRVSPRAQGPFVPINCCALPEALIESELFGHARGAFTGALHDRPGLFEAAERGTLLLDEVGDVPLLTQVKLLRVLQEHEVRRIGENRQRRVNVRLIAATNRTLTVDVAERRFRQDLYYRLRVVDLHVPPLRERLEDLRALAETLLTTIAREMRRAISGYTAAALERMLRYPWPGNIRELENVIERACALAAGALIDVDDLPVELNQGFAVAFASPNIRPLREMEREYILAALQRNDGNRTRTAEQLRIDAKSLRRKLKGYVAA